MDKTGWTLVKNKKKNKNTKEKTSSPEYDDWNKPTILRKNFKKMDIKVASRKGLTTLVPKKNSDRQRLYKVEQENENFSHKKISYDFKMALMKGRLSKKMTQEDLARAINVKKQIIIGYENGSIIPDNSVISKLRRVLNVKLSNK